MTEKIKVTAIVGSYRRGGIIDTAVDEILEAAREQGAEIKKFCLLDQHIEFCTNCRTCTQQEGAKRGECVSRDDMGGILDAIEASHALVLASPMNFGTVTALTKKFIERLVCYAFWPWGMNAPQLRNKRKNRCAVVVGSSAAPAFLDRVSTKMVKLLKWAATILGATTVGVLFIGLAAKEPKQGLGPHALRKARALGKKLVSKAAMLC